MVEYLPIWTLPSQATGTIPGKRPKNAGSDGFCSLHKPRNSGGDLMHAVVRTYSGQGAKELFEQFVQRKSEVEDLIRSVSGFTIA